MIGFSPIFVRWSQVGSISTAVFRVLLALPLFALFGFFESRRISFSISTESSGRPAWGWIALGGIGLALDLALWHMSLRHISVVNATLFANLAPIFVTFVAWFWLGEKVGGRFIVGLFLAITGAWILVLASPHAATSMTDGRIYLGTAQALGAAIFYALYILSMKMAMSGGHRKIGLGLTMLVSGGATLMTLMPLLVLSGENPWPPGISAWLVLLALAWISQGLGQGMIVKGLSVLPASFSSLTLLVQPVVAATLAWVLLSEALGWFQASGGIIVLSGIFLARQKT